MLHNPLATITYSNGSAVITALGGTVEVSAPAFDLLEAMLEAWRGPSDALLAGFLSYDLATEIEDLGPVPAPDFTFPQFYFALYDSALTFEKDQWRHSATTAWPTPPGLRSRPDRAAFEASVERIVATIRAGDIFQTNLSQRFEAPLTESPWSLYRRLRRLNAAPFAALMELPEAAILSASPERFLRVDGQGHVQTRPIKGTSPRGIGPEHDAALGQALTESAKDRAENLMIVDLMRNDLSRVCLPGTVRVPELFALERYATVHHLVSTVVGDLEPGRTPLDLLRAAFPGGSITGAPKVRAMEIIAELEPSRRSVYCGSLGYWSLSGELDTSIAIRTVIVRGGRIYFNAGGGIVADSNPEQEYRETLDKARGIIDALRTPS